MTDTPAALDLGRVYQTADEIADGFEATLECGLPVRLARTNSPKFLHFAGVAQKRFGRNGKIPPDKTLDAVIFTMARSVFLAFHGSVIVQGTKMQDSVEARELILRTYPDLREEIATLSSVADDDYKEAFEDSGKD